MKKERKYVSLGLAMLSFVFLFNPTISVIDVLPDVFGYMLLCMALRAMADLNGTVARARELFLRMALIDVIRILLIIVTFALSSGDSQEMMLLLIFFATGLIELYTLIPAYKSLFSGFMELGYKYDNTSVLTGPVGSSKNYSNKAMSHTFSFVVFKFTATLLPELAILTTHSYDDNRRASVFYEYMGLLRGAAVIFCLVIGIIWLVRMMRYFGRVRKDKVFITAIENEYRGSVLPRESIFIRRAIRGAFLLVCAAAFVLLDARLDGVNILPDVLSAVLLALCFIRMKKYLPKTNKYVLCATIYGITALLSDVCEARFFKNYYFGAIIRSEEAYEAYLVMLGSSVIEAIGFMAAIYGVVCFLGDVIVNYTGFMPIGSDARTKERIAALHAELKKKRYVIIACAILCGAGDALYPLIARYVGFAGLISGVCSLIFFAILVYTLFEINDEINAKYMLE